ncbi:unnamed protein product [Prunus brigantina]
MWRGCFLRERMLTSRFNTNTVSNQLSFSFLVFVLRNKKQTLKHNYFYRNLHPF